MIRPIARMCSAFIAACSICFTAGWKCKGCRGCVSAGRDATASPCGCAASPGYHGRQGWPATGGRPLSPPPSLTIETTLPGFRVSRVFCGPSLHTHNTKIFSHAYALEKKPGNPATRRNLLLSKDLTSGFLQTKTRQKPGNPAENHPHPPTCGHEKGATPARRPLRCGFWRVGTCYSSTILHSEVLVLWFTPCRRLNPPILTLAHRIR